MPWQPQYVQTHGYDIVGGRPEIYGQAGWTMTHPFVFGNRHAQAGWTMTHPHAYRAAMTAVMGTPAFQALAAHMGQLSDAQLTALATATAPAASAVPIGAVAPPPAITPAMAILQNPGGGGATAVPVGVTPAGVVVSPAGAVLAPAGSVVTQQTLPVALAMTPPAPVTPAFSGGPGVAYGSNPQVVDRPLMDIRQFPLGFISTGFPASAEASVVSRPQVVFRGERLIVPSNVSPSFAILDVKVGNRSQLVNSTALPAQMFIETAVGIRLSMDTAAVAQDVALIVQNTSSSSTTFQAAIIGTAAQ
jgi:hypothetical protein